MMLRIILIILAAFFGLPLGPAEQTGPLEPEEYVEIEVGEEVGGISLHQ